MATLTPKQRLLRRAWLMEWLPMLVTEATFHRMYDLEESRPQCVLWGLDAPEGVLTLSEITECG